MAAGRDLEPLDLSGVAISAELSPGGKLKAIGGVLEKLLAARHSRALPRVHTLLLAKDQRAQLDQLLADDTKRPPSNRLYSDLKLNDPHADFVILFADELEEARRKLAVDADTRWGGIPDFEREMRRHRDLLDRDSLEARVRAFVSSDVDGYLLLVAGPIFGKSAFITNLIRTSPDPAAYHFIKRGQGDWDEPDTILRSLTAQLRRIYALPTSDHERTMTPAGCFNAVLDRVSRVLAPDQRAVILIDGLDEAFGPDGRFTGTALPGVLPLVLPRGIRVVLTSRPGDHLNWLADPSLCQWLIVESDADENRTLIQRYIADQNQSRSLGLEGATIAHLVDAAEGFIGVAVLSLRERPGLEKEILAWRTDLSQIPRGLNGWLVTQHQRVSGAAAARQIPREELNALLGILASALEPLSRAHLIGLLNAAGGSHIGSVAATGLKQHIAGILEVAQEFFDARDPALGTGAPYRFFHTSFAEFVFKNLSDPERRDCHRLLARGCDGWRGHGGPTRDYALRHRIAHWQEACEWFETLRAFADVEYIVLRSQRSGFADVYAEALRLAQDGRLVPPWQATFVEWERFLRWRINRLREVPEAYGQELVNEFQPVARLD
jgi:hypothetical protein